MAQYQLQIFVSLLVILGAAFVALICDFLKGNNEQLRELAVELKVRREEERRQSRKLTAQAVEPLNHAVKERMRMEKIEQQRIEMRERGTEAPVSKSLVNRAIRDKRTPSPDALAAMQRGEALAAAPRRKVAAEAAPAPVAEPAAVVFEAPVQVKPQEKPIVKPVVNPAPSEKPVVEAPAEVIPAPKQITLVAKSALASNTGGKKDWAALLSKKPVQKVETETVINDTLLDAVVSATATQAAAAPVPAGFHENFVLSRLVQSRQPVSGLVVSIGVNTPREADGSMPEAVRDLVQSLIGPSDFACQSSAEEFLLIYPNERGSSAQRRLNEIAQKLWDFQIRNMGSLSILFTWGGVEVRSESIEEAIQSAADRMNETRRGRKLVTMEPRQEQALRQAV